MNRFTWSSWASSALVVGLLAAAPSCGGDVLVADASGAGGGSGTGASTTASNGTGASSTASNGTGASTTTGNGSGAGTGTGTGGTSSTGTASGSGAGTGAGTSTASSSSGTTGGPPPLAPCGGGPGTLGWIDDMDNDSPRIDPTDGRKGSWYTDNDATVGGTQTPAAMSLFAMTPIPASAPVPGHMLAASTSGSGFNAWGASMAFDLNNDGITYASYDASKFKGFCLWARVGPKADSGGHTIRLRFLDATTTPQGGICNPSTSSGTNQCYDGFGANLALTAEWQMFKFPWGSLAQQGWGKSAPAIAADKLYSVDFDTGVSDAFDTWVFGIEFF
jgi:hypothetical protein